MFNSLLRPSRPSSITPRQSARGISISGAASARWTAWAALSGLLTLFAANAALAAAPVFFTQPGNQTTTPGSDVGFFVTVVGNDATTYQWRKDGADLPGSTNRVLNLTGVTSGGSFSVVATNADGSTTSNAATLTIIPGHIGQPTVTVGHTARFDAGGVSGTIQWQVSTDGGLTWTNLDDGPNYAGAHTNALAVLNAPAGLDRRQYRFFTSAAGTTSTSSPVTLSVAPALLPFPTSIAIDRVGNILVGDAQTDTVKVVTQSGRVSLVAGTDGAAGTADGEGPAARFNQPNALLPLSDARVVVADTANATLREISAEVFVITIAGSPVARGNADGAGTVATFASPAGLAQDANGNIYVTDSMNNTIRRINPGGTVSTFAGDARFRGAADGRGSAARFNFPTGIALDRAGNVYVADTGNNTIRKITPAGDVTTLAGVEDVTGFDDGTGAGALFNRPEGLAIDRFDNLYVADSGNSTIRKITLAGVVTTFAGLPQVAGLEDGFGSGSVFALFSHPQAVSVDLEGNVYVADTGNAAIRKITPAGVVETLTLSAQTGGGTTGNGGGNPGGGGTTGNPGGGSGSPGTGGNPQSPPSSGSGYGGGSIEGWFVSLLAVGALVRRYRKADRAGVRPGL